MTNKELDEHITWAEEIFAKAGARYKEGDVPPEYLIGYHFCKVDFLRYAKAMRKN